MPRKESITEEMLLCAAFALAREQGIRNVTARKLAQKAGCSTQPIFRIYKNMEELSDAVFDRAAAYFSDFYGGYPKKWDTPFTSLAMAYISFARQEMNLFRMLFLAESPAKVSMYELINGGTNGFVRAELQKLKGLSAQKTGEIFSKMWIFIHGMACMALSGDFDLTADETVEMVEGTFEAFMRQKV